MNLSLFLPVVVGLGAWLVGCLFLHQRLRRYGVPGTKAALLAATLGAAVAASAFAPRAFWLLPLWLGCAMVSAVHVDAAAGRIRLLDRRRTVLRNRIT
jgi:hypothetical protein